MEELDRPDVDSFNHWLLPALVECGLVAQREEAFSLECLSDRLFSARILRVMLRRDGRPPLHLVVKCNPPGARLHGREVQFYDLVAPRSPAGLLVPCRCAHFDEATGRFLLVFDDLTETHEPAISAPFAYPTEDEAAAIVQSLAAFHAHWWEHPALQSEEFAAGWPDRERLRERILTMDKALKPRLSSIEQRLGADALAAYRSCRDLYPEARAARLASRKALTLTHGDAHGGNFLMARNGAGLPLMIDWPNWGTGLATDDLAVLVGGWPAALQDQRLCPLAALHCSALGQVEEEYHSDLLLSAQKAFLLALGNLVPEHPPDWAWALAQTSLQLFQRLHKG